jgi:hypothetical protein
MEVPFIIARAAYGDALNMADTLETTMDKSRIWIDFFNKQLGGRT